MFLLLMQIQRKYLEKHIAMTTKICNNIKTFEHKPF